MNLEGVGLAAAFGAGVASFASPCVLPLVPAYLSIIGGLEVTRLAPTLGANNAATGGTATPERSDRIAQPVEATATVAPVQSGRRTGVMALTLDTAMFIAGFGAVFVTLGLSASALGRAVIHEQTLLTRISGVLVVAMALFLLGTMLLSRPGLYREWRVHPRLARFGRLAAPVAGAAFAFGWTPCVGPILGSVLALSADQGHLLDGAILLAVYTLGLGLPFLTVALFFDRVRPALAWLRRNSNTVTATSAIVLGVMGILLVLDRLAWLTTAFQRVT
jgi:cytochrome c-type biogenesis protein